MTCAHAWVWRVVVQGPAHWWCYKCSAQGIEAGTAATVKQGAVHESPVGEADAPNTGMSGG
jgi:hypothetical protein